MYEIFLDDKSIILTNVRENIENVKYFPLKDVTFDEIIKELGRKEVSRIYLYHPKEEKLIKKFKKLVPTIKAGGGVVYNEEGKVLLIKRHGNWDLPKGKKEKGENIEYLSADQIIDKIQIRVNKTDIPALSNLPFEVTPDLKGFIEVIGKNINENGVPEYYKFSVVMYYPYDKELSIDIEFLAEFLEKNFSEEEVATYRKLMQITPGKHIKL